MYYQSAAIDVSFCAPRFPSTRVRITGTLGGDKVEHQLTIDSTTDIPCITKTFIRNHAKLRHNRVFPIPPGAISLRSADGTPLKILGHIRFTLKLGNKSLPVEALVVSHLGPDAISIDNSIMKKAFGAKLDWVAERLSIKNINITISVTHMRRHIRSKYCFVMTRDSNTEDIPVFVYNKYVIPVAHEELIRVSSTTRPQKDTLALIEPNTATPDTFKYTPQDKVWHALIVARTVTHWCVKN